MLETAMFLIILALAVFVIEIFVPSGGLLGILSFLLLMSGVVFLFMHDTTVGMVGLMLSLVLVPVAIVVALKIFPQTPIGRLMTLNESQKAGSIVLDPVRDKDPGSLVGAEGVCESELRPVGNCRINGHRLECLAEEGFLPAGTPIRVAAVRGIEIRVRRREGDAA